MYFGVPIGPSISPAMTCEKPMIAFSGVRVSWLILARNSVLLRLASSACSFAASKSRSAPLRSVMSSHTVTTIESSPSSPWNTDLVASSTRGIRAHRFRSAARAGALRAQEAADPQPEVAVVDRQQQMVGGAGVARAFEAVEILFGADDHDRNLGTGFEPTQPMDHGGGFARSRRGG